MLQKNTALSVTNLHAKDGKGAGGFGKTTLAAKLCHEDYVVPEFVDDILWVTLGETLAGRNRDATANATVCGAGII